MTAPSSFSTDAGKLRSALAGQGHTPRMVYVTVTDAPVWHDGDIVATVSGEFPAAYIGVLNETPLVLLDTGDVSVLASWRILSERKAEAWLGFDRFQIVLGHYVFCLLWHGGQTCPLYQRLCRIERYFKPGFQGLSLETPGNEMAAEVYGRLCEKHGVTEGGAS